jgi:nucleoside-diphosphate-sugar epimerase
LGRLVVGSLLGRGHSVRALVRTSDEAEALTVLGAAPVVGDLRGDIEWIADGCDAAVFAAGAHSRGDLAAIDAGGAAKLAEAADRFDLSHFVLCSAIGAADFARRRQPLRDFLAAKYSAERRLADLEVPWTILRFGGLTDEAPTGRIRTMVDGDQGRTLSRRDAATTIVETLRRPHLARQVVNVLQGDRHVADALDAIEPGALPPVHNSSLGAAQALDPAIDPAMLFPDAAPLDAAVDYEGDGPLPPEVVDNDDPSPGVP